MRARRNGVAGLVLAAVAACTPAPALAWGDEGHRVIALVAYRHLAPAVRGKVNQLLARDADTLTASDIASRSTWADTFRDSDRHTSRQRYRLTREWHFVDIELDEPDLTAACFGHPVATVPASVGPAKSCVVDRIAAFASELRDLPPASPERAIAFRAAEIHLGEPSGRGRRSVGDCKLQMPSVVRAREAPPCAERPRMD